MTERARLTDALALAARPRAREYAIHDTALQGFMLRVQPNGARSWVFRFRRDGKARRVTLGKPDAGEVRRGICRAALAVLEAIHAGGHHELPRQRYPAGHLRVGSARSCASAKAKSRSASRRCACSC